MKNQSYVYLIATALDDRLAAPVKVGVSNNPIGRLATLQTGSAHKLRIAHLFPLPSRGATLEIEVAASLIGLYIGTALIAGGLDDAAVNEMMRAAHALPADGGEFRLNEGRI